jgi:ATP-dependent RNA helicase HelY
MWEQVRSLEGRAGSQEAAARRRGVQEAVDGLRTGDVLEISHGKKRGRYAVLQVLPARSERAPRIVALSVERTVVRFSSTELREPPAPVARVEVPSDFTTKSSRARRELARKLNQVNGGARPSGRQPEGPLDRGEVDDLRRRLESHPCHRCPELGRHLHFLDRAARLEREVAGMDRRIHRRTGTLARRFNQVLEVLEHLGYVADWQLTGKGKDLTGVYNESDLLVVEALEQQLFDDLSPSELAAVCSTLVFETRGPEIEAVADMPTEASALAWTELMSLWADIHEQERVRGLELTREPDPGFARRAHHWAAGAPLEEVLGADDAPGDFVRSTKQLIDLLRQLAEIAPGAELGEKIRTALEGLQRGVVAYSSLDL